MTSYDWYTFFLCLIVFSALTVLFTTLLVYVVRLTIRLIRHGAEDEKIKIEYQKAQEHPKKFAWVEQVISSLICVALCLFFVFSLVLHFTENDLAKNLSSLKVVRSGSMSYAHEENTYLTDHGLNDHLQTFDLIVVKPLPDVDELELYDVVAYEAPTGEAIIHRIVEIVEFEGTDEPLFVFQGDAVQSRDGVMVSYDQMLGIYEGQRVPFVGSFVTFMQSPAGWLCILLVLFAMIATPIVEKKISDEKKKRLELIGLAEQDQAVIPVMSPVSLPDVAEALPVCPDFVRCPMEKKTLIARFRLKKGDMEMLNCMFAVDKVKVSMNRTVRAYSPFSSVHYGKTPIAKITFQGKMLDVGMEGECPCVTRKKPKPKKINVLFRRGPIPLAKLVITKKDMHVYLNLDQVGHPYTGARIDDVSTSKSKDQFQIRMRLSYPGKTSAVQKLVMCIEKNGTVSLKEEV